MSELILNIGALDYMAVSQPPEEAIIWICKWK